MRFINELRDGEMISSVYLVKDKKVCQTKAGKDYIAMHLHDKTGSIDAKIWDIGGPGYTNFENMDFVRVEAQVTSYMNNLQLNVRGVRKADINEYDPADYMPCSPIPLDNMVAALKDQIASVNEPHLNALLCTVFNNEYLEMFKKHSAAKSMHHNYVGGLIEHSLAVAKICDDIASMYGNINRDLLVTAALLHDIGKMEEISDFPENDYTMDGQLFGHIFIGANLISEQIKQMPDFPVQLGKDLVHCILTHHGELEYGSPKVPALIEAVALSHADNMDAKLRAFDDLIRNDSTADVNGWMGFNRMFDSALRKPVPYV